VDLARGSLFAGAYHNRGAIRQARGDLRGALADFDAALAMDPRHATTYANRGTARKAAGDLAGARADLDQAVELMPRAAAAAAYHNRGGVRVLQNDFRGAIADYTEAIAIAPGLLVAHISRGNARYHARDPRALADYVQARQLEEKATVAEIVGMLAADVAHDAAKVFDNCEKHLRISKADVTAYCRRGLSRLLLYGDDALARADLAAAIRLEPALETFIARLVEEALRWFGA